MVLLAYFETLPLFGYIRKQANRWHDRWTVLWFSTSCCILSLSAEIGLDHEANEVDPEQ